MQQPSLRDRHSNYIKFNLDLSLYPILKGHVLRIRVPKRFADEAIVLTLYSPSLGPGAYVDDPDDPDFWIIDDLEILSRNVLVMEDTEEKDLEFEKGGVKDEAKAKVDNEDLGCVRVKLEDSEAKNL